MTKEQTLEKMANQKERIEELEEELEARPVKIETVEVVNEIVIENSGQGGDIGALAKALSLSQKDFEAVKKNSEAHAYNFADITAVLAASKPIYTKNHLSIIQLNVSKMLGKTPLVGVKTILAHAEGGWISGEVYIPTLKTKMNSLVQMAGVNITYLRRYGIQSILGLSTTDNDGSDK